MEKDKFDLKMIDIESRSFEVNMLMSAFIAEILENFEQMESELYAEIPYYDPVSGYRTVIAESVFIEPDNGMILLTASGMKNPVMWDELNIAAKEIIIAELHHRYKSVKLYESLTVKDEIH
jgi:hypothetical protein